MTTLLSIADLSVDLQKKQILAGVNLSLASGNILGLVGPSGCGKTTLLNTIAGFVEQSHGDIILNETQVINTEHMLAPELRNIGMIFQDYALFPHLTVAQNIAFGIQGLSKLEQKERISQLLALLKLSELSDRFPHQLSGGQQQRIAIARALAPQPKLLLLDEPFSNIDARLRNELMLELRHLLKQLSMTAIFVTHNKDEVFTFADQIAVMHQGHVLQSGTPSEVFQHPNCWQVADFLQIGSWLPVLKKQQSYHTAFGALAESETLLINGQSQAVHNDDKLFLLLKPQHMSVESSKLSHTEPTFTSIPKTALKTAANVKVDYISLTERGFHYTLSSIIKDDELAPEHISFYSQDHYQLGEELTLHVIAHEYQLFSHSST